MSSHVIRATARKSMRSCSPASGCWCGCGECFTSEGCNCSRLADDLNRGGMTAALYSSSASTRDLGEMVSTSEIESFAMESIDAFGIDAFAGRVSDVSEETENHSRWEAAEMAADTWHFNAVRNPPRKVVAPPVGQPGREYFIAAARKRMERGEITEIGLGSTTTEAAFGHLRGSGLNPAMVGL